MKPVKKLPPPKAAKKATKEKSIEGLQNAMPVSPTSPAKPKKYGAFEEYEVREGFETMKRAEKIKGNADLLAQVKKYAGEEHSAIRSIADLKQKIADDTAAEEDDL